MPDRDVVIVGAGHNGLSAAAYLARAGRSCVLLERQAAPGGAAVSERIFPGLDARVSKYAYLVSLLPRQIVAELGLKVALARRTVSSCTPDPRTQASRALLVDERDERATLSSFRAVSGGERDARAWRELYAMTARVARAVFPTMTEPLLSRRQMRERLGDEEAWHAIFERPLSEMLRERFEDDLVAGVVLTDALIGTFATAEESRLRQNRCFLYHVIGRGSGDWLVPVGGMGTLSGALAQAALAAGAELRGGCEALAIEPERDRVAVRFSDGLREHAIAARHVLVGAAPAELARLLGATPAERPEGAQLKVNLLLSRLPRLRAGIDPSTAFAGTLHVNEMASQLQRAHDEAEQGRIPEVVPCEAYCHSLSDRSILGPELRGSQAQTLTVFALHMPARLFEQDPDGARERATQATLRSLQSVLGEPLADCLMHDGRGRPCVQTHTPLDLERSLRLPGGHIFHRDLRWPFAESEQEVGRWGVETEHPRVLLCGAGARRGGGVSAIPGRNAAMAVLERLS